MSVLQNVIYVLDSRLRTSGTINSASYNMIPAGTVRAGTYELLSYHSINQFYNVETGINDSLVWDEFASSDLIAKIPSGYYTETTLATAVGTVMTAASVGGDVNVYSAVYDALTGKLSIDSDNSTWRFNWTSTTQPTTDLANELVGFSLPDGVLGIQQVSDNQVSLLLHSMLIIDISEDSQQNVTLLSGAEHSLIVPLNQGYQEEIDSLKQQVFSQQIVLAADMNVLNVNLFTESGGSPVNSTEYELTLRRIF